MEDCYDGCMDEDTVKEGGEMKCKICGTLFRGDYGEAVDTVALRRAVTALNAIEEFPVDWTKGADENMENLRIIARDVLFIIKLMRALEKT